MKKYHPKIDDGINILLKRFDFQNYHHYCFLFTSKAQFPYPGGYVNLTNKAYIDGNLVNEGKNWITKVQTPYKSSKKKCKERSESVL